MEERLDRVFGGRLAGTHHAVDGDAGGRLVGGLVDPQGLRDVRPLIEVVGEQGAELLDIGGAHLAQQLFGELVVGTGHDFTGLGVDHRVGQRAAQQVVLGPRDALHAGSIQVADVLGVDPLVLGDDDLAVAIGDVEAGDLAAQALGHQFEHRAFGHQLDAVEDKEMRQDLFRRQADRLEQDGDRHLATAVDTEVQHVLGVELEVEPGTAIRDDPGRKQQLARAVGLATVMLEEHARRTV